MERPSIARLEDMKKRYNIISAILTDKAEEHAKAIVKMNRVAVKRDQLKGEMDFLENLAYSMMAQIQEQEHIIEERMQNAQ